MISLNSLYWENFGIANKATKWLDSVHRHSEKFWNKPTQGFWISSNKETQINCISLCRAAKKFRIGNKVSRMVWILFNRAASPRLAGEQNSTSKKL
jgi:hypothetical protein